MKDRGKPGAPSAIAVLLHALYEAYERNAWHGTTLTGSLKGVTAKEAAWRPAPNRHNIRELAVHAAYWKSIARRRLTGEKRASFPLKGSNWFRRDGADEKAWRSEKELLEKEHRLLRDAVASFPEARLARPLSGKTRRTALREIAGAALHDVYHTGQIQLVKVLGRTRRG